jgi:hypothetical protein
MGEEVQSACGKKLKWGVPETLIAVQPQSRGRNRTSPNSSSAQVFEDLEKLEEMRPDDDTL